MEERTILHSDLNNFYASVECMLEPSLRDKPVAVCGRVEERHGIVLAKNYAAKAFGVKTGESIYEAKGKCPKLITVDPHYKEYMKYSRLVRQIYYDYSDQVEAYGMDENWIDVTGSSVFGTDEQIAHRRLARGQMEVVLYVPGANEQSALLDIALQLFTAGGADLQVVLQNDGLGIQMEAVAGIGVQNVQEVIHQIHQSHAEVFQGQIPLSVPVRVRNDTILFGVLVHSAVPFV